MLQYFLSKSTKRWPTHFCNKLPKRISFIFFRFDFFFLSIFLYHAPALTIYILVTGVSWYIMLLFYNEITIKSFTLNQPSNLEQIQLRFCFSDEKNNSCETGTFFWVFHFIRLKLVVSITFIYFTKIN